MVKVMAKAKKWTCDGCGVTISRIGGERVALPESWERSDAGTFCLHCRRERAAQAALDAAPADSPIEARAKLRREALIEFEVRRRPSAPEAAGPHAQPLIPRRARRTR